MNAKDLDVLFGGSPGAAAAAVGMPDLLVRQ